MKKLLLLIVIFIISCGYMESMDIDIHYISREEMTERFGSVLGYAIWENETPIDGKQCDIYLMDSLEDYYNSEDCYEAVYDHEMRHCHEGKWHGDETYMEPACEEAKEIYQNNQNLSKNK